MDRRVAFPPALPWDLLPCSVIVLRDDGHALQVNARWRAEFGAPPEWLDLLEDVSRAELLAELPRRRDFGLQLQLRRADGSSGWADCAAQWIGGSSGVGGHLCMLHDVTAGKRAELAALARTQQFRLLADNLPVLIAYYEVDGLRCRFANRLYAQTFGHDERSVLGRPVDEIVGADAARAVRSQFETLLRERRTVAYERELRAADGTGTRWIEGNLVPHLDAAGEIVAAFVLLTDITRHRAAERALRESEERLAKFMQASAEGIVFHRAGVITDANPALCALLGRAVDELRGRSVLEFIAPEERAGVTAQMDASRDTTYESVVVGRDGGRIPIECIVRTLLHHGERLRMAVVRDLRDRRAAQARIHHLAHHDALTGLPNRMAILERLERLAGSSRAASRPFALLFVDLDHFKRVNDSLGHEAGDRVLCTVAARLTGALRASDSIARFGGDEFLVLLAGLSRRDEVDAVAAKLMQALEVAVDAAGGPIVVSPSIGVAFFPADAATPAELIRRADAAMYKAKQRGRANWRFYDAALADAPHADVVMEGELAHAVEHDEFVLQFQPQARTADGAPVGAEALIRWRHPGRGWLAPDAFIPLAERRRVMLPIGRWVLREALRAAAEWQHGMLDGAFVSVNLSTLQFDADGFVGEVADALRDTGLPGRLLELELTERMLTGELPDVDAKIAALQALGARISIDDFGTGATSLLQLKSLPLDKMKIDRTFVEGLPDDAKSAAIVRALVRMARGLGLVVVAEGVATDAQRRLLAGYGCDLVQGDAVSAPLDAAALREWAERAGGPKGVGIPAEPDPAD